MEDLTQTISNLVGILLGIVRRSGRRLLHLRRVPVPHRVGSARTRWSAARAP